MDGETAPGIFTDRLQFLFTHGHTPGHMHVLFRGDQRSVFFAGDLIPGRAWVHLPITMGYDRFPEKIIDEKEAVYQRAVKEDWWIFFTHDTEAPCARVETHEGKGHIIYKAANVMISLERFAI